LSAPIEPALESERLDEGEAAGRAALEATVALSLRVLRAAMVVLLVLFLSSGLFTVEPQEVALVRRLGRVQGPPEKRTLEPGAHWAWPVLDEVVRVEVERAERLSTDAFGMRLTEDEIVKGKPIVREGGIDPDGPDGYLLTGDANIIHATIAAQYRITDAYAFASRVKLEDSQALAALARPLLERAVARAAAARPVDDLLTTKKDAFLEEVLKILQDSLDKLGVGVRITGVELARDLQPPPQVREAFASVGAALQDRERIQSVARATASEAQGRALSEALRIREQARSEAKRILGEIDADVAVFDALLPVWRRDRAGLETRLLADAVASVKPEETFIVRPGEEPRLRLERDQKAAQEELLRRAREGTNDAGH
jgi:membrane protease subunit HflK